MTSPDNRINSSTYNGTKWLTYLVYFLIALLTFVSGWSKVESSRNAQRITDLSKGFVLRDQYMKDQDRLYQLILNIDAKIQRLLEAQAIGLSKRMDNPRHH